MTWFPRYVRLSLSRLWMRDVAYFGSKSRMVGGTTALRVTAVAEARQKSQRPVSWSAILIKAIALTARKRPEPKRAYIALPWPHFYDHPHCVATVVLEREWQGERAVFFDQIEAPEHKSLGEIDELLEDLKNRKIDDIAGFRRLIRVTRLPLPVRRLIWLAVLWTGRLKARYLGTFSLNSISLSHFRTTQTATPLTLTIEYGAIEANGEMPIQIFFDHRVLDGHTCFRLGVDVEATLNREIADELNACGEC